MSETTMNLEQAITVIDTHILIPDDLPHPASWQEIEQAIARLQEAKARREHCEYDLVQMISVSQTMLKLAKAGGYRVLASALAAEMNMGNWLDRLLEEERCCL